MKNTNIRVVNGRTGKQAAMTPALLPLCAVFSGLAWFTIHIPKRIKGTATRDECAVYYLKVA
jgi:hypothetical protein